MRVRRTSASGRHRASGRAGAGVPRGLLLAALALVAVPVALVLLVVLRVVAPGDEASLVPAPAPSGEQVVAEWDGRRAAAYAAGDTDALSALYPAGSALGEQDGAVLAAYGARGLRVHDLTFELLDVVVEAERHDRVVVVVTDRMPRAEVRRRDGTVVAHLPARGEGERRLVLERSEGAWVLVESERVSPSAPAPP